MWQDRQGCVAVLRCAVLSLAAADGLLGAVRARQLIAFVVGVFVVDVCCLHVAHVCFGDAGCARRAKLTLWRQPMVVAVAAALLWCGHVGSCIPLML